VGKKAKLGRKVLAGKLTVDEARAKLGRNVSRKRQSQAVVKGLPGGGISATDPAAPVTITARTAARWIQGNAQLAAYSEKLQKEVRKSREEAKKYHDWCLAATEAAIALPPPVKVSVAKAQRPVVKSAGPRFWWDYDVIPSFTGKSYTGMTLLEKSAHSPDPGEREYAHSELLRLRGY
jgi:hypothetical protein